MKSMYIATAVTYILCSMISIIVMLWKSYLIWLLSCSIMIVLITIISYLIRFDSLFNFV
jgi:hypothetical protein